jgi:protein-S-isoprenylcysteine O-methyltransferase Ste14
LASPQNKALITLVLGVLMLPGFAVFLSLMAVRNVQAFETSSTILTSFVVYALVVCVGVLVLVKIWQKKPVMIQKETEEKETPGR